MLIAITLTLTAATDATIATHVGRANYAATLQRLSEFDADLGTHIHDGPHGTGESGQSGPKPLTCSGIMNARSNRDGTHIRAGQEYFVRMTGLTSRVSEGIQAALLDDPPMTWLLDHQAFQVTAATCDPEADVWSGRTTYETLAADQLANAERPPRAVTLRFGSPTAFNSKGMTVPIPLPSLVFGSLVERWNAFSPVTLSPEMRRFGEEMIAISHYNLESRPVAQKNKGLRVGGMGSATYRALGGDRYWVSVMQMLAEFARYSGVGVQTTTGMGVVRRVKG